jgi:hypothetical protein
METHRKVKGACSVLSKPRKASCSLVFGVTVWLLVSASAFPQEPEIGYSQAACVDAEGKDGASADPSNPSASDTPGASSEQSREILVDFDWYKTQYGTGLGNCGPAAAAMAVHWATGADVSVEEIRDDIGEPNNSRAVSLDHLKTAIDGRGVPSRYTEVSSVEELHGVIDSGRIAILWIHTGWLSPSEGDVTSTRIGRYYEDECGHYIVLKGYTLDDQYFITYDPIPGGWYTNDKRYVDGTMLGKDRYYPVPEVWKSLKSRRIIVVDRTGAEG